MSKTFSEKCSRRSQPCERDGQETKTLRGIWHATSHPLHREACRKNTLTAPSIHEAPSLMRNDRGNRLIIAYGRDAADTAQLSEYGNLVMKDQRVRVDAAP